MLVARQQVCNFLRLLQQPVGLEGLEALSSTTNMQHTCVENLDVRNTGLHSCSIRLVLIARLL